jgi:hypothetical protein
VDAPAPAEQGPGRAALAATVAFVLLGIALRAAVAFPVHKYPADADCLNSGLVALRITDGHFPAWYTPRRIGSLECYVHAAAFRVLGPTREALAVAPLLSSSLALALYAGLALSLLGPVAGPLAVLLFALPPPAYVFWTYMPNCYPETLLLCVAVLWAADRARRRPDQAWRVGLFGLLAGLGFWNSIQTLSATLPAAAWLAAREDRPFRSARTLARAAAGFAVGALPWIAWNVAVPLGSFRHNFSVRPAAGASVLLDNVAYLVRYELPELLATLDPQNGVDSPSRLQAALRPAVLALWAAAGLAVLARAAAALVRRVRGTAGRAPAETPLVLVGLTVCLLATVSAAGEMRGLTVRYILPLFLLMPAAAAVLAEKALRRGPATGALAAAGLAAILVFNVAGYYLPGSAERRLWEKRRDADAEVIAFLSESGIEAVTGDYWVAYPVNFLSSRRIAGIPFQQDADFYGIEASLGARPLHWAVLAHTRAQLESLIAWTGTSGLLVEVAYDSWAFIPESNPEPAATFSSRFRTAYFASR